MISGKQVQAPAEEKEELDSSHVQADLMSFQYKVIKNLFGGGKAALFKAA